MSNEVDIRQLAIDRSSAPESRQRHFATRYVIPAILLIGFAALIVWAGRDYLWPPQKVQVVPVLAQRSAMQEAGSVLFQAAGWIQPRPTPIRVAALAPGVVRKLLVVEDQSLKVGQEIAQLVDEDARLAMNRVLAKRSLRLAELDQAKAALAAATTRLKRPVHLTAPLANAQAQLAKLNTQLQNLPYQIRRAAADVTFAKQDHAGKLAAVGAVAGRVVDAAKSKLDTAEALLHELRNRRAALLKEQLAMQQQVDALATKLKLLADEKKAFGEAKASVAAADARIRQTDVEIEECRLRLNRMTIRAPVAGRVYQLIGHPGARVGEGSGMGIMTGHDGSTVVTMYRPDQLQIRVDVRFEDVVDVQLGQSVEINNPGLETPIRGRVLFISSLVDIQKNTNEVKVGIDNPPRLFKPDMLVDVTFLAPEPANTQQTPQSTIRFYVPETLVLNHEQGQKFIWIADQSQGKAVQQSITLGKASANGMVEVTAGLNVSSRLIVSGAQGLQDGAKIVVTGEANDYVPFLPQKDREQGRKRSGGSQ